MRRWLLQRLLALPLLLLAMSVLTFALVAAAPGDPVLTEALRQGIALTPENHAALQRQLGLDGSLAERYGRWLSAALSGDLGRSIASGPRSSRARRALVRSRCAPAGAPTGRSSSRRARIRGSPEGARSTSASARRPARSG